MSGRTANEILADARAILETAELGGEDFLGGDVRRRLPGLRNVVVFGRAFTNVLENLRGPLGKERFDAWYLPRSAMMREDPLLRYFYLLRTEILKQGSLPFSSSSGLEHMNSEDLVEALGPRPPGATGWFVGDQLGGSGWDISYPDGSTGVYYVTLPESMGMWSSMNFPDPPTVHLGLVLDDTSVEALVPLLLAFYRKMLVEAEQEFGQ